MFIVVKINVKLSGKVAPPLNFGRRRVVGWDAGTGGVVEGYVVILLSENRVPVYLFKYQGQGVFRFINSKVRTLVGNRNK